MSTYTQLLYQIIFSTKHRAPVLCQENRPILFKYIWGVLAKKNCHLYRINGVEDHIHIVTHIHPSVALASLVKDIKIASADYIKDNALFPGFSNWQIGYAAFSYSIDAKAPLITYVKNQEEHHKTISFIDELRQLLEEHGVDYDPKYLE